MSNLTLYHIEPIGVCLQGKLQLEPLTFYKTASSDGSSNLQVVAVKYRRAMQIE